MFKTRNIVFFLVGAAVVGFLLDARRARIQSRESNDNQVSFTPQQEGALRIFGITPEAVG